MSKKFFFLAGVADILFVSLLATSSSPKLAPRPFIAKEINKETATALCKLIDPKFVPSHMQKFIANNLEHLADESENATAIGIPIRSCASPSEERTEAFARALDLAVKIQNRTSPTQDVISQSPGVRSHFLYDIEEDI